MWWWIDRWRKSSAYMNMTLEEQGAYRNLLDEAQLRGGALPTDERVLAKACGDALAWDRLRARVMAHFVLAPDGWHNVTLDSVLRASLGRAERQQRWRDRQAKHNADHNADHNAPHNADHNEGHSPYPSPSPSLISVSVSKEEKEKSAPPRRASLSGLSSVSRDPFLDRATTERAGAFVRRYQALYPQYRHGARYTVRDARDYAAAVTLCQTWPDDARLEKLAICFLTTDHKFAAEGSRTIPQFLALASWADGELATWEQARNGTT